MNERNNLTTEMYFKKVTKNPNPEQCFKLSITKSLLFRQAELNKRYALALTESATATTTTNL